MSKGDGLINMDNVGCAETSGGVMGEIEMRSRTFEPRKLYIVTESIYGSHKMTSMSFPYCIRD